MLYVELRKAYYLLYCQTRGSRDNSPVFPAIRCEMEGVMVCSKEECNLKEFVNESLFLLLYLFSNAKI